MERRRFMEVGIASGIGMGALQSLAAAAAQKDLSDRDEGCGRFVVVANQAYGTPRWDGRLRVAGSYVIANTYAPKQTAPYTVSLYKQFRRDNGEWRDVPVVPDYASDYQGVTKGVRDWIRVSQTSLTVCLFIPDRTLNLKAGPLELRHQLRFFDGNDRHFDRLDATISPIGAEVRIGKGGRSLFYGWGAVGQLAVDIYNVYDQAPVDVDLDG